MKYFLKMPLYTYILLIVIILYSSNWGVDPLHDGAIFPTAASLGDGHIIFKDIQNQYGLLQGIIEAIPISIFGPYLFIERLTGSIILILTSFYIFMSSKEIINSRIALCIAIFYLSLIPNWNTFETTSWPLVRNTWPNQYGVLFQILYIYAIQTYCKSKKNYLLTLSGALLAISALARIEFTISSVLVFILTLVILNRKEKLQFVIGYFFIVILVFLYLLKNNAVNFMIEQLLWALQDNGKNSVVFLNISGPIKLFITFMITVTLLMTSILFKNVRNSIIVFFALFIILSYFIYPQTLNNKGKIYSFLKILSGNANLSPIFLIIFIGNIYIIWMLIKLRIPSIRNSKISKIRNTNTLIYALCITSLLQVHNISYAYLYYILPIYLILFAKIYSEYMNIESKSYFHFRLKKVIVTIFLLSIILNFTNFLVAANKKTQTFTSPILIHMKSFDKENYLFVNKVTGFISSISKESKVSNNCQYGLFTVNQYGYVGSSRYPWNLLPDIQLSKKQEYDVLFPADYILDCVKDESKKSIDKFRNTGQFVINKDETLLIYKVENKQ